jgi:hypothetical protein
MDREMQTQGRKRWRDREYGMRGYIEMPKTGILKIEE